MKAEKSGGAREAIDGPGHGEIGFGVLPPVLSHVGPNDSGLGSERRESSQGLFVAQSGERLALVACLELLEALRSNDHGEGNILWR